MFLKKKHAGNFEVTNFSDVDLPLRLMVQSAKGSLYKVDGEGATRAPDSWGLHGSQGEQ